ncbi:LADA_0F08944g1_1 [Lachancea dasiensis]|uniref:LADA_0F08944g1_1 n=1 Tax=Lachancea dasiensis TaxID=1072105 RepID=A0A1G4JL12_9SACH|nr:LADA_0F08944g1_1 [Lachancea dasiensis]
MAASKADLSEDQRRLVYTYYRELRDFFQITGAKHDRSGSARAQKARSKLLKLYPSQFFELSTDVHDELQRRIDENQMQPDHLLPRESFHVKRNQARQKLANLSESRFNDLVDDILYEIQRRDYHELPPLNNVTEDSHNSAKPNLSLSPPQPSTAGSSRGYDVNQSPGRDEKDLSAVVPNATIQQSRVSPKKASIEWSSDEEDDQDGPGVARQSDPREGVTTEIGTHDHRLTATPRNNRLSQDSFNSSPAKKDYGAEDFSKRAEILQSASDSDSDTSTDKKVHATDKSNLDMNGHEQKPMNVHDPALYNGSTAPLAVTRPISPTLAYAERDEGTPERERHKRGPKIPTKVVKPSESIHGVQGDDSNINSEQGSPTRGLRGQRDILKSTSEEQSLEISPTAAGNVDPLPSQPSALTNKLVDEGANFQLVDSTPQVTAKNNGVGHWGSLKRASLEHENSKREVEVLIKEGEKMDEKITELEKANTFLSSSKSELETDLRNLKHENTDLKGQIDDLNSQLVNVSTEVLQLKKSQSTQADTSAVQNNQQKFTELTQQINSLSIENEKLKQTSAELELKLKLFRSSDQQGVSGNRSIGDSIKTGPKERSHLKLSMQYLSPDGQIPQALFTSFSSHVESIFVQFQEDRFSETFGNDLFETLAHMVECTYKIIALVDSSTNQEFIMIIKASLSHAITSVRYFALYHEILPLVTVESAISEVCFSLCRLVERVKITDSANRLDEDDRPKTPMISVTKESRNFSSTLEGFQDPQSSLYEKFDNSGTMSPVKPLKITQKVVKNATSPKSTHASRKPSSTLFASIVNPTSASEESLGSAQFRRANFSPPSDRQKSSHLPVDHDVRQLVSVAGRERVLQPSSPSERDLKLAELEKCPASLALNENGKSPEVSASVVHTEQHSEMSPEEKEPINATKSIDTAARAGPEVKNRNFGHLRDQLSSKETDQTISSDEETMDEGHTHRNDDSNLTSDDDLTYQLLKENMRKKQQTDDTLGYSQHSSPHKSEADSLPVEKAALQESVAIFPEQAKEAISVDANVTSGLNNHLGGRKVNEDIGSQNQRANGSPFLKISGPKIDAETSQLEGTGGQLSFSPEVEKKPIGLKQVGHANISPHSHSVGHNHDATMANVVPSTLTNENDFSQVKLKESPTESISAQKDLKTVEKGATQAKSSDHGPGTIDVEEGKPSKPSDMDHKRTPMTGVSHAETIGSSEKRVEPLVKQEEFVIPQQGDESGMVRRTTSETSQKFNVETGQRESSDESDFDIDAFEIDNPDNTLSELLLYLEHRTIEVISTIQSLLTSIKQPQISKGELCKGSSAINQVIVQMVEATDVSMAQSRNAALKEHGNWVVQSLKDCKRRMKSLCHLHDDGTIKADQSDSDYADKHFKQRLAGVAFDVAKCTKELVKTVEEASLKEEIEYLNSKLAH